jgi:hypothetical protein
MKYQYITKEGNIAITGDVLFIPEYIEEVGGVLFEKKNSTSIENKEIDKDSIEDSTSIELQAKEFLRDKKVRGF